ncbi:MAG: tetraacyldisaccharide 4'-kinase [Deltaproteobacteria bacterium]|nr:tetraacyldisaccharide 4'-kinase [Deltaproteobacteria bacterium]
MERFFQYIAYGEPERGKAFFLNALLFPFYLLSLIYGLVVRARISLYKWGLKEMKSLPCKVISVGNITVGGTGKTPVVEYIARQLTEKGLKVAILSRGYKGNSDGPVNVVSDGKSVLMEPGQAGDEPYMLARRLKKIPVIVGPDRYETGTYALNNFKIDALILDDAYQHIRLKRDINILLIDSERGFGNGHLFPRGPLREPLSNADRADIILLTRCRSKAETGSALILDSLKLNALPPTFKSGYEPTKMRSFRTGREEAAAILTGKKIVALSGIANPASFSALLSALGGELLHEAVFADHHAYSINDIDRVMKKAESLGADMIVTTEKDAVKIEDIDERIKVPFYYLQIGLELFGDDERFAGNILSKCGIRGT